MFCPDRTPDQQFGAMHGAEAHGGACIPLVEKQDPSAEPKESTHDIHIERLQAEVTTFLGAYNQFLACCKGDLAELRRIDELGDHVTELLTAAQSGLFSEHMKLRGWTMRELLSPIVKARTDLKTLRAQLEHLGEAREKIGELGYEDAAKEAARLREIEESLDHVIRSRPLSTGPKTGTSIGSSPSVGGAIGKTPRTGAQIGAEGAVGADFGANPRTGRELGVTGPTGFEIGGTGRAGPEIGESRLNRDQSAVGSDLPPSAVNSSLPDTTVGSSLTPSTIGSSLGDTSIGSSLGGSSVGSTLQNHSR